MIEYDFHIALEEALEGDKKPCEINFPASCVVMLRHNSKTPDTIDIKVNLPDGESFIYKTKVVKAQSYSFGDIFKRRLFLLLPYYLMRYEGMIGRIVEDENLRSQLIAECTSIRNELISAMARAGSMMLYEELTALIIRVSNYVFRQNEKLQDEVNKAMGGEVLELLHERAERLEREALDRGLEQGLEQGLEEGLEGGLSGLAARLKERGIDAAAIDEEMAKVRAECRMEAERKKAERRKEAERRKAEREKEAESKKD